MPRNEDSKIIPPMMHDSGRPPRSRAVLGVLVALLIVAVLLALWALIFNNGDDSGAAADSEPLPTPLTLATSTPVAAATATPVPTPDVEPTPLAEGLQSCDEEAMPLITTTYTVDTNTTPLNQRVEPSVAAEQIGTFDAGQANLVFTGECVVNVEDGFTWWKIFNGTADVWVASDFVTVN